MDREFECLKGTMETQINTTAADEHVPEMERRNRVTKERFRAARNRAPHFKKLPNIMIIEIARQNVLWLNAFPVKASISKDISPRVMMTGIPIDYTKHCRCPLLAFVHTHGLSDSTDKPRTVGAICLGPTGNEQGTYTFLNLATGCRIYRTKWTELPTPQYAIDCVHALATKDKNSIDIIFKNRYQVAFSELEGVDDGWTDPANDEGVYTGAENDNAAEDSDGDTSEDSTYVDTEEQDDDHPPDWGPAPDGTDTDVSGDEEENEDTAPTLSDDTDGNDKNDDESTLGNEPETAIAEPPLVEQKIMTEATTTETTKMN